MSQIGFGESAIPHTSPCADPTATSDPHRPWTSPVHDSFGANNGANNLDALGAVVESGAIDYQSQNLGLSQDSLHNFPEYALTPMADPHNNLLQELSACNQKCQQAYTLLQQAQEQLRLSQLVIQRQETLIATLQERIVQQDSLLKESQASCDDLKDRLKRQQHHTSQLKAALERCLEHDSKEPKSASMPTSWGVTKLAEERILPVVSEQTSSVSVDQIPATPMMTDITTDALAMAHDELKPSTQNPCNSDASNLGRGTAFDVALHSPEQDSASEQNSQPPNVQTIETPAVTVKNPFPPKLSRQLSGHISGHKWSSPTLTIGVPQLPTWQNSQTSTSSHGDSARDVPSQQNTPNSSASSAMALTGKNTSLNSPEPELAAQMSAYPTPLAMPQVNPPKFLQHLGENLPKEDSTPQSERSEQGLRTKRITMAAVQLPQFPPMGRR